jgi:hypothetical protein
MACHVNPAGGGKRTAFGQIYGQSVLPAKPSTAPLNEVVSRYLDLGADLRSSLTANVVPNADNSTAFSTDRATFYVEAKLIPNRLSLYLDQRFAPGMSSRESWLMFKSENQQWFMKAGTFYLPYGLRLEDDSAFIREVTGVSFNNADNGVMIGHDKNQWSTRFSISNGTNGGAETNKSKQASLRVAYIQPKWRVGMSANTNKGTEKVSRSMYNVFAALNAYDIEWLVETDWINDKDGDEKTKQKISFIEANKEIIKGHNLKLTYEYLDPNNKVKEDQRNRTSLVWEYTPISLMQIRVGARLSNGIPQNPVQNTDSYFAQLHVWF